jgi:hypothetical protein
MSGKDGIKDPRFVIEHASDPESAAISFDTWELNGEVSIPAV